MIETMEQLELEIQRWGFMPFFRNGVEGFCIEDIVAPGKLFDEDNMAGGDGAWEWKGPIISHWQAAYGKFFARKAGFVSLQWLPDFINMRRSAFPLDSLDGDAPHILEVLRQSESMLSHELKKACGYSLARRRTRFNPDNPLEPVRLERTGSQFDAIINQLQMGTWVCIADFEYKRTADGRPYGWGVARYCTPEAMYELDIVRAIEGRTPQESRQRILSHLHQLFPHATDKALAKIV